MTPFLFIYLFAPVMATTFQELPMLSAMTPQQSREYLTVYATLKVKAFTQRSVADTALHTSEM